ncbi:MAG: hypothetical protein ABMA64_18335, partial [Myxococcota bacterium]
MARMSLLDPVGPYFFGGADLGPAVHGVVSRLFVETLQTAWDETGVVLAGVARIAEAGGSRFSFLGAEWDFHDAGVTFRLTVPRLPTGVLPAAEVEDPSLLALLNAWGADSGTAPSDWPGTQFRLELMLELVTLTFPDLVGGKLDPVKKRIVADPDHPEVKLHLPRITLVVTQGSEGPDTPFDVTVASWGAENLDDQDPGIASLISFEPEYFFVDPQVAFGLRSVVLDVDDARTPPEILEKFGIGDDWKGLYLPQVSVFVASQESSGWVVLGAGKDLLFGFSPTRSVWGELALDVINEGEQLEVEIMLYDQLGRPLPPALTGTTDEVDRYRVSVPADPGVENALLHVSVNHGAAPITIREISGREHDTMSLPTPEEFDADGVDLSVTQQSRVFLFDQQLVLRITSRNAAQTKHVVLDVYPKFAEPARALPTDTRPVKPAILDIAPGPTQLVTVVRDTPTHATLKVIPPTGVTLTVGGQVQTLDEEGQATVPLDYGASAPVQARWQNTGGPPEALFCHFYLDHPTTGEAGAPLDQIETSTRSATLQWQSDRVTAPFYVPGGSAAVSRFLDGIAATDTVTIHGYASSEGRTGDRAANVALSSRRAQYVERVLREAGLPAGVTVTPVPHGQDGAPSPGHVPGNVPAERARGTAGYGYGEKWWVAVASRTGTVSADPFTLDGTLRRDPRPTDSPEKGRQPDPPQGQRPDWLRSLGGTLRLEPGGWVAELRGTIDVHTAAEEQLDTYRGHLQAGTENPDEQSEALDRSNPADGVVEMRLQVAHDEATGNWTETLVVRSDAADTDGLWHWGEIPTQEGLTEPPEETQDFGRDLLGITAAFAPLLASTAAEEPSDGKLVTLGVELGIPTALAALDLLHVERLTWYGAELVVKHRSEQGEGALLLDVESALWLNLSVAGLVLARVKPDRPIRVRYRGVGFSITLGDEGESVFSPVFDASKGYTLDLTDSGSLEILPQLGSKFSDLFQIVAARIARTNPLNVEVELGLGVDLGVISVDRLGFRLPLDPLGPPTLDRVGIGVNVPGAVEGSGYLAFAADGITGQLDLTLPAIDLRVAAGVGIREATDGARTAPAVLVTLASEFPAGIPVAGSGLSLFGLLGLFAMHYRRNEDPSAANPALAWLQSVQGDPTNVVGWTPALDRWAFGVGAAEHRA